MYGYALVLLLSEISRIPGTLMAPMNAQKQNMIDEHGMIIKKDKLAYDQSSKWGSETSVNSRVEMMSCSYTFLADVSSALSIWQ